MVTIVLAAISAATLYALWHIFRNYLVATPMVNLPRPPPRSIFLGASSRLQFMGSHVFHQAICMTSWEGKPGNVWPTWLRHTVQQ